MVGFSVVSDGLQVKNLFYTDFVENRVATTTLAASKASAFEEVATHRRLKRPVGAHGFFGGFVFP